MAFTKLHARIAEIPITRYEENTTAPADDLLIIEEPLEIRVSYVEAGISRECTISITMRTPGHDAMLATGFLLAEGILSSKSDIQAVRETPTGGRDKPFAAAITVELAPHVSFDPAALERHLFSTSSCGVCGRLNLDHLPAPAKKPGGFTVAKDVIYKLPDVITNAQTLFQHTGGLHAAALFNGAGQLIHLSEDVGRHNAMDRLLGFAFTTDGLLALQTQIVLFSGRVSYELMQKAVVAGLPVVASIGAPSSLAVEIASNYEVTLIGFLRNNRFNVYTGQQRVVG